MNKKITVIEYNSLNLPIAITFQDGSSTRNVYSSAGVKLRSVRKQGSRTTTTDYCGNVIYENGALSKVLTQEGYVTLSGTTPTYHYYLQDHLGNNRVVINQSGTVEEVNHYYPFGGLFHTSSTSLQAYKYNGKELDRTGGLDWYDYGARNMDAALGVFPQVDPMCEKYYGVSPYAYCNNNPIRFSDPNGKDGWDKVKGFYAAVIDNASLGLINLRGTFSYNDPGDYNQGQDIGDVASAAVGSYEAASGEGLVESGAATAVVGVAAEGVTLGTSTVVVAAGGVQVIEGAALMAHGSYMAAKSVDNLASQKGRVSESSKNDGGGNGTSGNSVKTPEYKKAKSGSGKEKATDIPDWVKGSKPYKGENGKSFAKRLIEERLGKGAKYETGPKSDYNKIKKWGDRGFE